MTLNPLSTLAFFCTLLSLPTGVMVLLKNPRETVNRTFFIVCLGITFWQSYFYVVYNFDPSLPIIREWHKVIYCGVTFIPIGALHHVTSSLNLTRYDFVNKVNYTLGILACFLIALTPYILNGTQRFPWGTYPKAGLYHDAYMYYMIAIIITLLFLLLQYGILKQKDLQRKNQAKYMLLGYFFLSLGAIDFPIKYGIDHYPVGYITSTIFILIIAYAMVKYQLMDINIIIKKSLAYSLLITLVTVIYALLVTFFSHVLQIQLGWANLAPSLVAALLIAAVFYPLHMRIQSGIDRLFFKASPMAIAQENVFLRQEVEKSEHHKAIATLASGIAHEIKNPLTAVKTFTEYLPDKLKDEAFLQNFSRLVGHEVARIDAMVNQLLEFARPAPLAVRPTDMNRLINDTLAFLNSNFLKHHIQVTTSFDPACDAPISVDPNKLKQALLNILLNAVDAMTDGGTLTVSTCQTPQNHIEITIADTGPGIATADLPHIFDPFFSKKDHGTGLGLSITQGIIQDHGGRIWVNQNLGTGASFLLTIPIIKQAE